MEDLKDLKELVELLKKAQDDEERINFLQKIDAKLINDYEIVINDLTIEPLLVEAYYYDEEKFPDKNTHSANPSKANTYKLARKRQRGNFGQLYVHYGTNDGIDIVLSDGYYALSFLIKNALVYDKSQIQNDDEKFQSGNFKTQVQISNIICKKINKINNCDKANECEKGCCCKHYNKDKAILKPLNKSHKYEIVFTQRKNLKCNYNDKNLAALPIDIIRNYEFTAGKSKTNIIQNYIDEKLASGDYDEEKLKQLARGLISWKKFEG